MENLPTKKITLKEINEFTSKTAEDAILTTDENKIPEQESAKNTAEALNLKNPKSRQKTKAEEKISEAVKNQDLSAIDNTLKELADNDPLFKKALNGVHLADKLNSKILGKIVYQNFKKIQPKKGKEFVNQIPNEYAFEATMNSGFNTFASWDKQKGNFYIESTEKLDKIINEINKINPESEMSNLLNKENPDQIIGKINNMTEEEFKSILLMDNEENKIKKDTEKKKGEKTNPETIPQTEEEIRRARIAELIKNQEKRNEKILALEKKIEELHKILMQIQENEAKQKLDPKLDEPIDKISLEEKKPTKIDFYLSIPNSDGSFNESSIKKSYTEGASIYAFQSIGNNKYEIYFANEESAKKLALVYPDKSINPIFEGISAFNPRAKTLQIIKPAIVELTNGKFNLISKGEIDYDMVGIQNSLNNPDDLEMETSASENTNTETVSEKEEPKPEINSRKEYEPKNIIGYLSIPNKDGSFSDKAFTEKPQETSSMYQVEDLGNNRIAVSFWNNIRAVKDTTSSPELILQPIFTAKNALNQNATKIVTLKPAILEKIGDKYSRIKKGEVEYI